MSDSSDSLVLRPFDARYASLVAGWVRGEAELLRLAPGTDPPLTPQKVLAWHRSDVNPYLGWLPAAGEPVAYGEVNYMSRAKHEMWLGHILVAPDRRGMGLGKQLVQRLLDLAFFRFAAQKVCLLVFPDNEAAVRCYESAGMVRAGIEHWRHPQRRCVYRMLRMEVDAKKYRALMASQRPTAE